MFKNNLHLDLTQDSWSSGYENVTRQFIEAASDGKYNQKALKKGLRSLKKATRKDYNVQLGAGVLENDTLCLTLKSQKAGTVKQAVGDFYGDPIKVSYEFKNSSCFQDSTSIKIYSDRIGEAFSELIKSYKQIVSIRQAEGQSMSFAAKLLKKLGKH